MSIKIIDTSRGFDKHDVVVILTIGLGVLAFLLVFAPLMITMLFAMHYVVASVVSTLATLVIIPAVTIALACLMRHLLVITLQHLEQWSGVVKEDTK
jgi:uncharacterized membrane protein